MSKLETRKIQVELPVRAAARLDYLKEVLEASTTTEVMRTALKVLEEVVRAHEDGGEFLLRMKDGTTMTFLTMYKP